MMNANFYGWPIKPISLGNHGQSQYVHHTHTHTLFTIIIHHRLNKIKKCRMIRLLPSFYVNSFGYMTIDCSKRNKTKNIPIQNNHIHFGRQFIYVVVVWCVLWCVFDPIDISNAAKIVIKIQTNKKMSEIK